MRAIIEIIPKISSVDHAKIALLRATDFSQGWSVEEPLDLMTDIF